MKIIISTTGLLILLFNISFGQNPKVLNGYKYIFLESLIYEDNTIDKYGVSNEISKTLTNAGFEIISNNQKNWSNEALENPCLILQCFVNHTYDSFAGIKVMITFKNCKNIIVYENTGNQFIANPTSTYFLKAARKAISPIKNLKYYYDNSITPEFEYPDVENTNETEESLRNYYLKNKLNSLEGIYKSYQDETISHYKIGIKKIENLYKAIILESDFQQWKIGEVKAIFEPSSMNGFYSTKWFMGDKTQIETFARMENEAILSIEFKNEQTGEKYSNKFVKIFPPVESEITHKKVQKSSGSGFLLTSNGIIATNAHVVENAAKLVIQISNEIGNFEYQAKILLIDSRNDVALIKIDDDEFNGFSSIPYSFVEKAEIGEKTFTIGYPLNDVMGRNYKVTDGIVSSVSGIEDDLRYYQISVPLQPGNSGGPLFNSSGDIIGITSARLNSKAVGVDIENVNYAIKISYLLNLYKMLPNVETLNTKPTQTVEQLQDQVKILKNYVCLIKVN